MVVHHGGAVYETDAPRGFPPDPEAVLCLGWAVGGWHGRHDGLAALALLPNGAIERVGRWARRPLGHCIADGTFGMAELLASVGLLRVSIAADDPSVDELRAGPPAQGAPIVEARPGHHKRAARYPRVVIGIGAPLGLPEHYVAAAASSFTRFANLPRGLAHQAVENRLAYRETERAIAQRFRDAMPAGWRQRSPTFDRLGGRLTKARYGVATLRADASWGAVRVVPFEDDTHPIAIIEVAPALWDAALAVTDWSANFRAILERMAHRGTDAREVREAHRCALAAACYEATRIDQSPGLPRVLLPGASAAVRTEGWIYAPAPTQAIGNAGRAPSRRHGAP